MFAIVKEDLTELLSTYPQIAEKMWKSYGTKIGIPLLQELPEYQVSSKNSYISHYNHVCNYVGLDCHEAVTPLCTRLYGIRECPA